MKHNVCSKMWSDINIRIPQKTLINCCKRQMLNPLSVDEISKMGKDVLTSRKELIEDKKSFIKSNIIPEKGCSECSKNYPNGYNSAHNIWKNKQWSKTELKNLLNQDLTKYYEVMLSTTCNMACLNCNEKVSSTWADKIGTPRLQSDSTWKNAILKSMFEHMETNQHNNITINFLGGEPFLDLHIFDILEKIIDIFEKKQTCGHKIMFTTNLNVKTKILHKFFEMIEHSSNKFQWAICPSVDAVGHYGENIRVGLNWELFSQNLNLVMNNKKINWVSLVPSISSMSVSKHYELLKWYIDIAESSGRLLEKNWGVSNNMINNPGAMNPNRLPKSYKKYMIKSANLILPYDQVHAEYLLTIEKIIGSYKKDENDSQQSLTYFTEQSKIHNIDYLSMPVIKDILNVEE